ncbi:Putative transcriptional regulator, TetR family [Mycobacteroides abscessus subsp. massiliense]|nr:Putative transcriptional regulator, TetR family [Mycobacteroides abscessus subsp. massiliense]
MVREFSAMEPVLSRPIGRLDARQDIENALAQGFTNALEAVAERLPALIFVCTEAAGVDPEALQSIIQFFRFASVRSEQSVYSMIEFLGQAFVSLLVGAVTLVVDDDGRTDRIDEYARAITHFLLYGLNPAP